MYLVDSSVILKWFFPNEKGAEEAIRLFRLMQRKEVELSTDSSVIHEVANVLHGKGDLSVQEITLAISKVFDDGLSLVGSDQKSLINAIRIGFTEKIGTHDAILITVATSNNSTLVTADNLLYRVAQKYADARLLRDIYC